jgi:hypothetical protein
VHPVLKTEINGPGDPLRWPRDTLYPQKLALASLTSGGRSVGIVRLRTTSHGVFFFSGRYYVLPEYWPFPLGHSVQWCHQQRDLDRHQVFGVYHLYSYILYNVGERMEPFGTPACISLGVDCPLVLFITIRLGPRRKYRSPVEMQLLPLNCCVRVCWRSRYLANAVAYSLISLSLPRNGSTYPNI